MRCLREGGPPREAEAWSALGNIQLGLGEHEPALASFAKSIDLKSANLEAWVGFARASTLLERPQSAEAWLEVLALNPPGALVKEACQALAAGAPPAVCGGD